MPGGRGAMLREINAKLLRAAGEETILLDLEHISATVGKQRWENPKQWHVAKQHPSSEGLVPLVEHQMAAVRAVLGLAKKVLVLDLDNVMWGGVIGEDGLDKIQLGPPSPAGEAFQAFQHYVRQLKTRGVLLAVCSKNNEADAKLPFESSPETVLKIEDFVAFSANWQDKATNLKQMAEDLSLGLDSFVFLDDNPVERAWVRSQIPEMAVPELPSDPAYYIDAIQEGRFFEANTLSAEDRTRHESYRSNIQRKELRQKAGSLEGFLEQLAMRARNGPFDAANMRRIAQLVNKTNQFNLTTRRYTEAQLTEQAGDPQWWTQWFRLADRFSDHGLIGVMTCRPHPRDSDALEIDNWLMSCRVLGRGMEVYMLQKAIEYCGSAGIERLVGCYIPTAKNSQVRDLFSRFQGQPVDSNEPEQFCYVLDVRAITLPACTIAEEPAPKTP
ncbi:MAG: hypothetical protein A2V70_15210 [Planctomycetes bacterium RBG_13_63_9]|nr:MAG: hypothetical protein A2V70_15210 [Planctomycetes bacterium RBG_13_63_9]